MRATPPPHGLHACDVAGQIVERMGDRQRRNVAGLAMQHVAEVGLGKLLVIGKNSGDF